jgi:hypothetical protein
MYGYRQSRPPNPDGGSAASTPAEAQEGEPENVDVPMIIAITIAVGCMIVAYSQSHV